MTTHNSDFGLSVASTMGIYDKIDVDMIKNMIANNAFEDENLYNLATYIISLIKRFQPPIMDEEVDTWEQGMLAQFKESFEYSDFLVTFFKSVFNMIENIIIYNKQLLENLDNINNLDNTDNMSDINHIMKSRSSHSPESS